MLITTELETNKFEKRLIVYLDTVSIVQKHRYESYINLMKNLLDYEDPLIAFVKNDNIRILVNMMKLLKYDIVEINELLKFKINTIYNV